MRVDALIEQLKMFPDDMEVYIQTVPDDFAQPLTQKLMRLIAASAHEIYGLEQAKLLFTAHIPEKRIDHDQR